MINKSAINRLNLNVLSIIAGIIEHRFNARLKQMFFCY